MLCWRCRQSCPDIVVAVIFLVRAKREWIGIRISDRRGDAPRRMKRQLDGLHAQAQTCVGIECWSVTTSHVSQYGVRLPKGNAGWVGRSNPGPPSGGSILTPQTGKHTYKIGLSEEFFR